jgi:hypothetical protein
MLLTELAQLRFILGTYVIPKGATGMEAAATRDVV